MNLFIKFSDVTLLAGYLGSEAHSLFTIGWDFLLLELFPIFALVSY